MADDPWETPDDEPGDWGGEAAAWQPVTPQPEFARPAELDDADRYYGPEYWMYRQRRDRGLDR